MRHDDGAHDADGLSQLDGSAALAVRHKHPLQQLALVWTHCYILKRKQRVISKAKHLEDVN